MWSERACAPAATNPADLQTPLCRSRPLGRKRNPAQPETARMLSEREINAYYRLANAIEWARGY